MMFTSFANSNQPSRPTPNEERLADDLTLEWLFDHKAICITVGGTRPEIISAWIQRRWQIAAAWPVGVPTFEFIDLTSKECTVTPLLWKQAKSLHRILRTVNTRAVIAVRKENWLVSQMIQTYVQVCKLDGIDMRIEIVHSRQEGLDWLEQQIKAADLH